MKFEGKAYKNIYQILNNLFIQNSINNETCFSCTISVFHLVISLQFDHLFNGLFLDHLADLVVTDLIDCLQSTLL